MNARTMIAIQKWTESINSNTTIDAPALRAQMGPMNVCAISGGRSIQMGATVIFPISSGYSIAVTLTAGDDYTVRRIFVRAGQITVKAETEHVYAEQIGDVAYQMSCFQNAA